MRWADVTLDDGTVLTPVLVHDDHIGIRFYAAERGRPYLLGVIVDGKIREWGTKIVERDPVTNVRTSIKRAVVITGDLPTSFASIAYKGGCQCTHVLKRFRPPFEWEPLP